MKEHNQQSSVLKEGTLEIHTRDSNIFFKLLKTYGMYEDTRQNFFIAKYMN